MTATKAKSAFSTQLQLSNGASPAVFTPLAEQVSITGPALLRNWIEATHQESPDGAKEFVKGILEIGVISCDCNFTGDASQDSVTTKLNAVPGSVKATYRIVWPDFGTVALTATVDDTTDTWTTVSNHGWNTAQPVTFTTTGALPTSTPQLRLGRVYYAARTAANTVKIYLTSADAIAGANAIDFTTLGSGTHTINGGTSWQFTAGAKTFAPSAPKDDRLSVSIEFQGSGGITVSP